MGDGRHSFAINIQVLSPSSKAGQLSVYFYWHCLSVCLLDMLLDTG